MRLQPGQPAIEFNVIDIDGNPLKLQDFEGRRLMISFYRYASCPLCNIRMQELIERYPAFEDQGLHVVAFFQSPEESIREYVGRQSIPFPIVPDPEQRIYELYAVESSLWGAVVVAGRWSARMREANGAGFMGGRREGNIARVPADFLVAPDQTIHTAFYGKTIADHIPFELIDQFLQETA